MLYQGRGHRSESLQQRKIQKVCLLNDDFPVKTLNRDSILPQNISIIRSKESCNKFNIVKLQELPSLCFLWARSSNLRSPKTQRVWGRNKSIRDKCLCNDCLNHDARDIWHCSTRCRICIWPKNQRKLMTKQLSAIAIETFTHINWSRISIVIYIKSSCQQPAI